MAFENAKRFVEHATGLAMPGAEEVQKLLRKSKVTAVQLKDDGFIPNHPRWPLLFYPSCVRLAKHRDPAAIFEALFAFNGWGRGWRDSVYDFVHYHSRTHEVLAIARGKARLQFGGFKGRIVTVKAGDAAILPAGTGHQRLWASEDFLAVGAYPPKGVYDECKNVEDRKRAKLTVPKTAKPKRDPLYGTDGPLLKRWR